MHVARLALFVALVAPSLTSVQDPASTQATATFEVASVRRNTSGSLRQSSDQSPSGQITITNVTLRDLVRDAYGIRDQQLLGGPAWFDGDHFDIRAKAPANATGPQVDAMKRGLLAGHFKLAVHWERRELPVYELVLARADGRLGPGLRPRPDCAPGETRANADAPCGGALIGPGRITVRGQGLPGFAADRIVIDKTGLTGSFDVDLEFTPAPGELTGFGPPPPADAPALPVALQEQLGLRLQPARAMVDVLVVDRAEPLTDDPTFDVVSVRPRAREQRPSMSGIRLLPGGRVQAIHVTVRQMIAAAHQLLDLQIVSAPPWTSEWVFDVEGTEIDRQTVWLNSDGGRCLVLFITMSNQSHMTMREMTMQTFARRLTLQLGRLVLDRTGLEGFYDVDLTYTSEAQALSSTGEAPAILTAVREQLGLRLDSVREPVPVLVIDAVERPTAN